MKLKKPCRARIRLLLAAAVFHAAAAAPARAAVTTIGGAMNLTQIAGIAPSVGAGASNTGTLRVILANDSPAGSVSGSSATSVGLFLTSPPTLANGTTSPIMLDNKGNTLVSVNVALPAGAATIGAVNIAAAQTLATVTTVGAVTAITNALPAGTNLLGKVGIDQTTPGTTNGVQVNAALPTGTNTVGAVNIPALATITQSSVTLNGTNNNSVVVFAADANRKSFEITALPGNVDYAICKWGGPAVSTDTIILPAGANYVPTHGVQTASFNCISNGGASLVLRGNSYAP